MLQLLLLLPLLDILRGLNSGAERQTQHKYMRTIDDFTLSTDARAHANTHTHTHTHTHKHTPQHRKPVTQHGQHDDAGGPYIDGGGLMHDLEQHLVWGLGFGVGV